jgi:DNA-binding transcriptional regulator PaaX
VLFDVPSGRDAERDRLRRYLRSRGYGYLQKSVWISPDPLEDELPILEKGKVNVESLTILEGRACAGESNANIVEGAWDFDQINRRYARHLSVLDERPLEPLRTKAASSALARWAAAEHDAWIEAVTNDPLLPTRLLPLTYLGQQAWRKRMRILQIAAAQLRTFEL